MPIYDFSNFNTDNQGYSNINNLPDFRSDVEKEFRYFDRHRDRMRYRYFRRKEIPIGSGAVESAIRRVINLRLKAPGSFWREDTAEVFL